MGNLKSKNKEIQFDIQKNEISREISNPEKIPSFPWIEKYIDAYVYDVHDGDTIKVIISYQNIDFNVSIRLNDIDTPEISRCSDLEKKAGIKVRDYLKTLIEKKWVKIYCTGWDKYGGRIDGNVYFRGNPVKSPSLSILAIDNKTYINLSDHLLAIKYAKLYNGKEEKTPWEISELKTICFQYAP